MNKYTHPKKINILAPITLILLSFMFVMAVTNGFSNRINDRSRFESEVQSGGFDTENKVETNTDNWKLILVNSNNSLPENYEVKLKTLKNNIKVDERIYPDLQSMFDDARASGVYPLIGSAYRTSKEQQRLYTDKIDAYLLEGYSKKEAKKQASAWVALPGTSEHQLGLALDINADKEKCDNDDVYEWLNKNSYKYGFILRYPTDKAKITGVNHEPWHYRYVGKKYAKEIYEKGVCLEEYLKK